MPLTLSNTNNIDKTYQPVIAEIKRSVEHNTLMDRRVDEEPIPPGHSSIEIPYAGRMFAGPLSEGVPYSVPRTFAIKTVPLTAEEKGVMSTVTRIAERRTTASLKSLLGQLHGDAMVRLRDEDGFNEFTDFTKVYGTTSTKINFLALMRAKTDITRARSEHFGGRMPSEMPVAVFETGVIDVLMENTVGVNSSNTGQAWQTNINPPDDLQKDAAKMWWRGRLKLAGVDVYEGRNIKVTDSGGNGSATGAVFVKSAIALASEGTIMTNQQYNLPLRGDMLESHGWWAYHIKVNSRGVKLTSQCQAFDKITD